MEASTRLDLEAGKYYQISTDSDDGVRFFFKDPATGQVIQELEGDWRHRSIFEPTAGQLVQVQDTGEYDFYVHYYEAASASVVNITVEEVNPLGQGRLVEPWTSLTFKEKPATTATDIGDIFNYETFTVIGQISPNSEESWYKIQTSNNEIGYIADFLYGQDYSEVISASNPESIVISKNI